MNHRPHDEWIFGTGETGRQYAVHTRAPRFIGELFEAEDVDLTQICVRVPDGDKASGFAVLMLADSQEVLTNIVWIDTPELDGEDARAIVESLEAALGENDFRAGAELDRHIEEEIGGGDD